MANIYGFHILMLTSTEPKTAKANSLNLLNLSMETSSMAQKRLSHSEPKSNWNTKTARLGLLRCETICWLHL